MLIKCELVDKYVVHHMKYVLSQGLLYSCKFWWTSSKPPLIQIRSLFGLFYSIACLFQSQQSYHEDDSPGYERFGHEEVNA